jgi:hypothetical protein
MALLDDVALAGDGDGTAFVPCVAIVSPPLKLAVRSTSLLFVAPQPLATSISKSAKTAVTRACDRV